MAGNKVDQSLQSRFSRGVRGGGPGGSSTRSDCDGLLADASWRGMGERGGGTRLADYRLRYAAGSG